MSELRLTFEKWKINSDTPLPWSVDNGDGTLSLDTEALIDSVNADPQEAATRAVEACSICPEYYNQVLTVIETAFKKTVDPNDRVSNGQARILSRKVDGLRHPEDDDGITPC